MRIKARRGWSHVVRCIGLLEFEVKTLQTSDHTAKSALLWVWSNSNWSIFWGKPYQRTQLEGFYSMSKQPIGCMDIVFHERRFVPTDLKQADGSSLHMTLLYALRYIYHELTFLSLCQIFFLLLSIVLIRYALICNLARSTCKVCFSLRSCKINVIFSTSSVIFSVLIIFSDIVFA